MSVFVGKQSPRWQYKEASIAQINAATSLTNGFELDLFQREIQFWYLNNRSDVDIQVYIVNPAADQTVNTNRLLLLELGSGEIMNFDPIKSPNLALDSGTRVFIVRSGGTAATLGKLTSFAWG